MQNLIPTINKLQDVFQKVGNLDTINLPRIAVVGSQSSGKSSVLENIVGKDFLPRGSGIVTRRPLILQLIHNNKNEEYGEFLHKPKQKFLDFQQIKKEIEKQTFEGCGNNKGISNMPIRLKITSPRVLNLTLIDLPGITKNPVGDQPKDIEHQIRKLLLHYISAKNTIILAVSPANVDIANSDALKLARSVDKRGDRTLGVLTKLDLMDEGTDAMDILTGKVITLKKGFIGVVNRSQKDIETKKHISDALKSEELFFSRHDKYRNISSRMGVGYLTKTLNNMLLQHIRECLPDLKTKIATLISKTQIRLKSYGNPLSNDINKGGQLLQLLTDYCKLFSDTLDGKNTNSMGNIESTYGGAKIKEIFTDKYAPTLSNLEPFDGLSDHEIKLIIKNSKGPRTSLFVPEAAFELLVKRQVKLLEPHSLRCVDFVKEVIKGIASSSCDKPLARFPRLQDRTKEYVFQIIAEYTEPLKLFISNLINIEASYINTNHPDFFSGGTNAIFLMNRLTQQQQQIHQFNPNQGKPKLPPKNVDNNWDPSANSKFDYDYNPSNNVQKRQPQQFKAPTSMKRSEQEVFIIKELLNEYFRIVRKRICDTVPKSIMHFLVLKIQQNLYTKLVAELYNEKDFDLLLQEKDGIAQKRKSHQKMLQVLLQSQEIVNEIRDTKF